MSGSASASSTSVSPVNDLEMSAVRNILVLHIDYESAAFVLCKNQATDMIEIWDENPALNRRRLSSVKESLESFIQSLCAAQKYDQVILVGVDRKSVSKRDLPLRFDLGCSSIKYEEYVRGKSEKNPAWVFCDYGKSMGSLTTAAMIEAELSDVRKANPKDLISFIYVGRTDLMTDADLSSLERASQLNESNLQLYRFNALKIMKFIKKRDLSGHYTKKIGGVVRDFYCSDFKEKIQKKLCPRRVLSCMSGELSFDTSVIDAAISRMIPKPPVFSLAELFRTSNHDSETVLSVSGDFDL